MSWPTAIRMFSGMVALWSAVQVAYLTITFSMSPPSPLAELMSTHDEGVYIAFFVVHCIALVVFGIGACLPGNVWRRLDEPGEGDGVAVLALTSIGLALAIFIISLVSIWVPKYEVFLDLSTESIVKRDTHLLPPGVTQLTIPFGEIDVITGEFVRKEKDYRYYYDYRLSVITRDGRRIRLAEDFPRQRTDAEPPPEAISLAEAIAEKSGAEVDLR